MLRSTPAADVSSRPISHPSASRQHPPTPRTSYMSSLTPLGSILSSLPLASSPCLVPEKARGFASLPPGSSSWVLQAVTHGSALVLSLPSIGLAMAWEGEWQWDRARMGEQGQDGEMGTGWWDGAGHSRLWAGQQDVVRTQEVGWSPKVNRWLAKPDGGSRAH